MNDPPKLVTIWDLPVWQGSDRDFCEQDSGIQIVRLSVSSGRDGHCHLAAAAPVPLKSQLCEARQKPREKKDHFLGFRSKTDPSKWSTMGAERIDHAALSAPLLPPRILTFYFSSPPFVEGVRSSFQWNAIQHHENELCTILRFFFFPCIFERFLQIIRYEIIRIIEISISFFLYNHCN